MANFKSTVITNQGYALINKAVAGMTEISFTQVALSSNQYPDDTDYAGLTSLAGVEMTVTPSEATILTETTFEVVGVFINANNPNEFQIWNVGVYATDPDVGTILFSVTPAESPAITFPNEEGSPTTFRAQPEYVVDSTSTITINTNFAGLVTVDQLNAQLIKYVPKNWLGVPTEDSGYQIENNFFNSPQGIGTTLFSVSNKANYAVLSTSNTSVNFYSIGEDNKFHAVPIINAAEVVLPYSGIYLSENGELGIGYSGIGQHVIIFRREAAGFRYYESSPFPISGMTNPTQIKASRDCKYIFIAGTVNSTARIYIGKINDDNTVTWGSTSYGLSGSMGYGTTIETLPDGRALFVRATTNITNGGFIVAANENMTSWTPYSFGTRTPDAMPFAAIRQTGYQNGYFWVIGATVSSNTDQYLRAYRFDHETGNLTLLAEMNLWTEFGRQGLNSNLLNLDSTGRKILISTAETSSSGNYIHLIRLNTANQLSSDPTIRNILWNTAAGVVGYMNKLFYNDGAMIFLPRSGTTFQASTFNRAFYDYAVRGVATLDEDGKLDQEQWPDIDAVSKSDAIPLANEAVGSPGVSDEVSRSDHIHPIVPIDIPQPADTLPLAAGTANAGTSMLWSRSDHVHPHDSTKTDVGDDLNWDVSIFPTYAPPHFWQGIDTRLDITWDQINDDFILNGTFYLNATNRGPGLTLGIIPVAPDGQTWAAVGFEYISGTASYGTSGAGNRVRVDWYYGSPEDDGSNDEYIALIANLNPGTDPIIRAYRPSTYDLTRPSYLVLTYNAGAGVCTFTNYRFRIRTSFDTITGGDLNPGDLPSYQNVIRSTRNVYHHTLSIIGNTQAKLTYLIDPNIMG